jgi:hypothetical protein
MDPALAFDDALGFLEHTPGVLRGLLAELDPHWLDANEGPGTYSARDVLGHLIHGEDTDWIPRLEHLLEHGERVPFTPFDREGMRGRFEVAFSGIHELLAHFARRRAESLARMRALDLAPADGARTGRHPELGRVTLAQLVATWVVHDLTHLAQIARVLAKARADEIGPWRAYFRLLEDRQPKPA